MSVIVIKPVAELVVPATGWSIVGSIEEENSDCETLWRAPLVAFLIQTFRRSVDETTFVGVTPVTANGDVSDVQEYALTYGDRPPFFTVFEDFADERELLAYFNEQRRAMRQATAAAKSRERAREAEISSDPPQVRWRTIKERLAAQLGKAKVEAWFDKLIFEKLDHGVIVLQAPTKFHADEIANRYETDILSACRTLDPTVARLVIHVAPRDRSEVEISSAKAQPAAELKSRVRPGLGKIKEAPVRRSA